ncbi:MAG TPA: glycosyltransferase family 1 protein [Candidatus Hydrogenedentes bacterium]|nr:glycosyltransferase family 1 protein [Candidatus Hydrogenedentota bacterium]
MRIGIEVSPLTRTRTGVGNYTYFLLKYLLSENTDHQFHAFSSGWAEICLQGLNNLERHRHVPAPTRALYACWSLLGRPNVDKLLGGVDVYHATNYFLPPVASARRVLSIYDLAFLKHPEWCSPKIVKPFSNNIRRFSRDADAIIVCSNATKHDVAELLEVPPEKITVAYGAVDEEFSPMPRQEAERRVAEKFGLPIPYLLFVSTLEPRKNIEGLLGAFAKIQGEVPHTLALAGALGWNMGDIEARIHSLGLESRVRRIGYVADRADLPALYSAAEAFVFPSFYEGFGLPVLEAMTCGCPVIVSNQASLPEVAGDAARYVDPVDIDGIAQAMREVIQDSELRASMRKKGLFQSHLFSWKACAQATLGVYRRLAG